MRLITGNGYNRGEFAPNSTAERNDARERAAAAAKRESFARSFNERSDARFEFCTRDIDVASYKKVYTFVREGSPIEFGLSSDMIVKSDDAT